MKTQTNFLKIERKNKSKFYLFLNDSFITFNDLMVFCSKIEKDSLFFINVIFEEKLIVDGYLVFDNLANFEKNIYYLSSGKILS